eukprot:TRINITY_DN56739_c0_g1_i1.p1 TRINITY_DN56739_c0_g1~~TRINITY_DN56739_c0_g1_i1.p1  ORF type:complete len:1111 (+),score=160.50 TRINITY_DN56739_c0_g1_i1:235-3567(+)
MATPLVARPTSAPRSGRRPTALTTSSIATHAVLASAAAGTASPGQHGALAMTSPPPLVLPQSLTSRNQGTPSNSSVSTLVRSASGLLPMESDRRSSKSSNASCMSVSFRGLQRCPKCSATLAKTGMKHCAECGPRIALSGSLPRPGQRRVGLDLPSPAEESEEAQKLLACLRLEPVDHVAVTSLLDSTKAIVNAREDDFGWSPLLFAAHLGDAKLIMLLLDAKADIHASCLHGNTSLHLTARNGHQHAASLILSRNADIEATNAHGWTPLMWGALAGCQEVVSVLLDSGACVASQDTAGRTACMWAARHGHTEVVRVFLALGIDLSMQDENGMTAKDHADAYGELWKSIAAAEQRQLDEIAEAGNIDGNDGGSLYWSTEDGSLDLTRLMRQHGVIAAPTRTSGTVGSIENYEALATAIEKSLAASARLLDAAQANTWDAAEEALRASACVATRGGPELMFPLAWAAVHNASAAIMNLVSAKAALDTRDRFGWTALHHAVHTRSCEATSVLHYLGAEFQDKSFDGDTPLHLAARADSPQMVQLLHAAGSGVELQDDEGWTPLQAAAMRGNTAAVRTLLAVRADATVKDQDGRSVLSLAATHGRTSVVEACLKPVMALPKLWETEHLVKTLLELPWVAAAPPELENTPSSHHDVTSNHGANKQKRRSQKVPLARIAMNPIKEEDEEELSSGSISPRVVRPRSGESCASLGSYPSHTTKASKTNLRKRSDARTLPSTRSRASSLADISVPNDKASSKSRLSDKQSSQERSPKQTKSGSRHKSCYSTKSSVVSAVSAAGSQSSTRTIAETVTVAHLISSPVALMWATIVSTGCSIEDVRGQKHSIHMAGGVEKLPVATVSSKPPALGVAALAVVDAEGRAPLALAANFQHPDVAAALLRFLAPVDATDHEGNTALMVAVTCGDRLTVTHILAAKASVDLKNKKNQSAVDLAENTDLRTLLAAQYARNAVDRKLRGSCSLPSLTSKNGAAIKMPSKRTTTGAPLEASSLGGRLRLDCLPRRPADRLEEFIWGFLERSGAPFPTSLDVPLDPISLRPRGHAYLEFRTAAQAEDAAGCFENLQADEEVEDDEDEDEDDQEYRSVRVHIAGFNNRKQS